MSIETKLYVIDNSGIKKVKFIQAIGIKNKKVFFNYCDYIKVSTIKKKQTKFIIKKKINLGLVISLKKIFRRKGYSYIKSNKNNILILKDKENIFGSKIKGAIIKNSKKINKKFISLCRYAF